LAKTKTKQKKKSKRLVILKEVWGNFGSHLTVRLEVSPQPAGCMICKFVIPAYEPRVRVIAMTRDVARTRNGVKLNRTELKAHRRCLRRFMNPSHGRLDTQCYSCLSEICEGATLGATFRRGRWTFNLCVLCMDKVTLSECACCRELFIRSDLSPKISEETKNWFVGRDEAIVGSLWCERCTMNYGITTVRSKRQDERRDMVFYENYYKARKQLQELIDGSP
jgi:hypothetical protein